MATAIAAPGIPLDQIDPSQLVAPTEAVAGVALEDVNPADLAVPGVALEEIDPGQLATEEEYLAKLTPGQLVERKAKALFENRPAHETSKYDAPAIKRYQESNSLFSKDLRTPEEKAAEGEAPEPLPNLPFGLEKVLPEGLTKFAVNATAGTFTLMNEAAKKVLRADLMATRFTSDEEKKAFEAAGQKAPLLKIFPIPETEKPGAAIAAATLGNTARGAALVMEGAEDIAHLMFGRDQAEAASKLASKGVANPYARKAQERFDAQVALRLAAMRAEAGTPVMVNPQGQIEFGQEVPKPADRPDAETVASIQQSPIADPTNFIPMGTGFAATRKPLLAGATLAAKEAPGAIPAALAKVTDAAAKGMHAAERAIDTSPIAQGLMAAATTAAVGGDAPQAALAALLGANVKNLGLAHRTIGRVGDSLDTTTGKLLGQIPPGPIGRFAASTYRTLGPEARTLALGQVYNMPFLLGADTEEEFTDMVMAGAFAHAVGSAAGRTLNGLNISKNFFDAGDRAPEIRLPVKDVGVDPFLDAAHQELVSGLNNASNNFVESVRQAVSKGGGEAYVVSLEAYHKYLDDLVGKEVIGRDGASRVWTPEDAALAKNQQGMSVQTRAEDGSVRKVQLTPIRDVQPGLSVGHEATHFLERALLSDDERAFLQRETLRYYGEADAHNYFVRHMDLLEPGRDRAGDPASWADMTPEQREFTLSEIIAEHGNAAFNAIPIGKFGFDTGAQSYARTVYGMLGRMLERMGVKRPELSPEGFDPASKPTTGLGIEPSIRLSTLIENLIQAKMLDGELPASVGAKPASVDVAPRASQDTPKNVRPVEPKMTKPGFKKGDPIGDLRNEDGRLIGRDAVVKVDVGDGTYDVEYTDTATGRRVVGTVPGKWLESEVKPGAINPERQVFPTSPITSESPTGAAVAPTLPVPKTVENTTRPEGPSEGSAKTSANPNVRTTPEKQQALAGPADPQVVQKNKSLLQEIEKQPRSARGPVETDYYSAKSPVSSPNQIIREKQRLAADAAEQDGQPNPLRTRYQKIFVPYKVVENKNGTTSVFGMSLDKVAQNLDLLRGWLKSNPEAALVIDQAYLSGPEIAADLKKYLANQANGYAGDGRKLTRPADARDITPETPGYIPDRLPPDRAKVLNLLMGMEQPKTESPGQAFARRFAEANGITVGTIDGVSETNSLRARLRERGFDPAILNAVVENLRVDRLTTPLKPRPDLTFPAGDTGIQRAGFMPQLARRAQGNDETRGVVRRYLERTGIESEPHERYASIDEPRMKRIADWFEQAKHEPENPEVQAAYRALAEETKAQYQEMLDAGITIEPFEGKGEPYTSSADMMRDVRENKHLFFLSTDKAFGEGADTGANPLLEPSGIRAGGRELLMNDLFRAVHDYFGHTAEGFEFGPRGEYNAYLAHSRMFSDAAKPALAAETLAQNSWVNFGPHLRRADGSLPRPGEEGYVAPKDRRFADQKTTIVPPELLREADAGADFMPQFKLGKTKVEYGDEYTPVLKGAKVVGRIEPDFANEGFRAMTVERDDLGTAPSPKEALKLFTVDNIKPAKKELASVEKPKKSTAPAPTGWLLPDGEYAGQNDRTGVYQNTGDWHGEHILQNADDYASRFGLKRGRSEDLRLAALRSGFVRLRYDGTNGRMGVEANAKHFKKQLPKLEDILEQNLGKIDRLDVNLFDDDGKVVRANGEAIFRLDDFAKSQAVMDILRGRPIRSADFMPSRSDPDDFSRETRHANVIARVVGRDSLFSEDYGVRPDALASRVLYIEEISAQPKGKGHGSRALAQLVKEAKAANLDQIALVTSDSDPKLPSFFTKQGFRELGRNESGQALMVRELKADGAGAKFMAVPKPAEALQEFKADTLSKALKRPGWAILTATQEKLGPATDPKNLEANAVLELELARRGLPFVKVAGSYLGEDQGVNFLVTGVSEKTALALGKKFKQESVLTNRGYLYQDGSIAPLKHKNTVIGEEAKKQSGYTILPDGTAFSAGIDWDTRIQPDVRDTPAFRKIAKHLTESEREGLRSDVAKDLVDQFHELPQDNEFAVAVKLGLVKKGWYERAAKTLRTMFGPDTDAFVSLLAATSPRQSVDENLKMSLRVWKKWNDAGRPLDPDQLREMFAKDVELEARLNNTVRALTGKDLEDAPIAAPKKLNEGTLLSGFKVESFRRNLLNDLSHSTNDSWMAQFAEVNQAIFGTKSGYLAFTAKVRRVAADLGLEPAHVQETVWSFFKTLVESTKVDRPAAEVLANLSEQDIVNTPEFHEQIIADPEVRTLLSDLGFGDEQIAGLVDPEIAGRRANASDRPLAAVALEEKAGNRRVLERIAARAQRIKDRELADSKAAPAPADDGENPF